MPTSKTFVNCDMPEQGELFEGNHIHVAVYSAPAPGAGGHNEDCAGVFFVSNKNSILVVADGMGGMPNGDQASATVIRAFEHTLQAPAGRDSYREEILNSIEQANREIITLAAGSTLAAVEINDNVLRSYHVGDTEILVTGQKGKIKHRTVSHSPTGYGLEAGLLNQQEALNHEERHLLLNMVGSPEMSVEISYPLKLARYDTVVLGSDGLFDNLHIDEIVEIIRKRPLQTVTNTLVSISRDRMTRPSSSEPSKPDDLTFILVRRTR